LISIVLANAKPLPNLQELTVTGGLTKAVSELVAPILIATPVDTTSIQLSWDVVDGATGYGVERLDGVIAFVFETSYLDTGLSPNTSYSYRVFAFNDDTQSDYSNVATATTLDVVKENLHLNATPQGRVVFLDWNDVGGPYEILRRNPGREWTVIAVVNDNKYADTVGVGHFQYRIRVADQISNVTNVKIK
jgi:hypothetical protein